MILRGGQDGFIVLRDKGDALGLDDGPSRGRQFRGTLPRR